MVVVVGFLSVCLSVYKELVVVDMLSPAFVRSSRRQRFFQRRGDLSTSHAGRPGHALAIRRTAPSLSAREFYTRRQR